MLGAVYRASHKHSTKAIVAFTREIPINGTAKTA